MNNVISVIITTYKRSPNLLKRAILSVIKQTYQSIELLIVDDSPPNFEYRPEIEDMICQFADNRLKLIKHPRNYGVSTARNTGIKFAKGAFIAFLDDDDEWLSEKLQKQILLMNDSEVGLVYCRRYICNDDTNLKHIHQRKYFSGQVFDELISGNFIGSPSFVLVRRECFDRAGMFNEQMNYSEDFEMWLRIAKEYKICYIDEPLAIYHVHKLERATLNYNKVIHGMLELNKIHSEYLSCHKHIKSVRLFRLAICYLLVKKRKKALHTYMSAIRLMPFKIKIIIKYTIKMIVYFNRNDNSGESVTSQHNS